MIKELYKNLRKKLGIDVRENIFNTLPKHAVCAELGVFRGDFSELILKYAQPEEAHFIDVWWTQFGEYFPDWGVYTDFGKLKTKDAHNEAVSRINKYPCKSTVFVGSDLEYLEKMPDNYFDWAYIDSTHQYDQTKKELAVLLRKIKDNGIICGHDWLDDERHRHYGVKKAVVEFCNEHNWGLIYRDNFMQWAIRRTTD